MNQIRFIGILAFVRLVTEESASPEARTAPFISERGVEILLDGVTRGFAQNKETFKLNHQTISI
jgi:hypothetical protein